MPRTTIPFKKVEISNTGIHLFVKVKINSKPALFVLDTGASQTVMDQSRLAHFLPTQKKRKTGSVSSGLGTNTMESHAATIKSLKIGDLLLQEFEVVLLNLNHVNQTYGSLKLNEIDGILGSDILNDYNGVIDFKNAIIKLDA